MKFAKKIYDLQKWTRAYSTGKRERALAERDKQYIRSKRSYKHLPDSWTNTQWIKRPICWKNRSKKKHQHEEHILSRYELNNFYNLAASKEEFLYKLQILKEKDPNEWKYLVSAKTYSISFIGEEDDYKIAFELYEEGLIIGEVLYEGIDYKHPILIRCKLP